MQQLQATISHALMSLPEIIKKGFSLNARYLTYRYTT